MIKIKDCKKCSLCKTRKNIVLGEGSKTSKILFLGEAPGRQEDLQAKPFVGSAGKFLNEILREAGLKRENIYITNIVKCRPPGNRAPRNDEIKACAPYLEEQIKELKPKIIVLLGNSAARALLDKTIQLTKAHGTTYKKDNIIYFIMYHPASALYLNKLKKVMIEDARKLRALL
jgi:DNA polymerase